MHGNVWEWCYDFYSDYTPDAVINPSGPSRGSSRVLRGGSWNYKARYTRSACRDNYTPAYSDNHVGFRLSQGQKNRAAKLQQE